MTGTATSDCGENVQTGELLKTLKKRTAFEDFEGRRCQTVSFFSPNGNMIASGSGNGAIRLWNPTHR